MLGKPGSAPPGPGQERQSGGEVGNGSPAFASSRRRPGGDFAPMEKVPDPFFGIGARIRYFEIGPPDAATPSKMQDATPNPGVSLVQDRGTSNNRTRDRVTWCWIITYRKSTFAISTRQKWTEGRCTRFERGI